MNTSAETKVKQLATLALPSTPESVNEIVTILERLREMYDIKEDVYGSLIVAVSEAVNNSVLHGNKQDPAKQVHVDIELRGAYRLLVRVADEGDGFDPDSLPSPVEETRLFHPQGRGVYFMRIMADEVVFLNEGREVEMQFNI